MSGEMYQPCVTTGTNKIDLVPVERDHPPLVRETMIIAIPTDSLVDQAAYTGKDPMKAAGA